MTFKFTDLQEKWLTALENGEYPQCEGRLRKESGYCCLGVAADLIDNTAWRRIPPIATREGGWSWHEELDVLKVYEELNLRGRTGLIDWELYKGEKEHPFRIYADLAELNDQGHSFAEIAAFIRENPTLVFTKGA